MGFWSELGHIFVSPIYNTAMCERPLKKVQVVQICLCFSSKRYFFSIFELKYLFDPAWIWKHMNKIWKNKIVCLFVPAVVHNHLSSSSFCVFRTGGVLVFVKDQGLSRVFGFPSFGCFWVFSFDVFAFPSSKGDCIGFLSVNGVGAFAAFWGVSPSFLCVSGCFPSPFLPFSLLFPLYSKKYTHLHTRTITVLILHTLLKKIYTHLHTRYLPLCL